MGWPMSDSKNPFIAALEEERNKNAASIGAELCRALGLERVVSLTIECSSADVAMVTTKQFLTRRQEREIIETLSKFELKGVCVEGIPVIDPPKEASTVRPPLDSQYQPD